MDDLGARKSTLRRKMLARRGRVTGAQAERVGSAIAHSVVASEMFRAARILALYAAAPGEPSMIPLFLETLAAGKRVALPRCTDNADLEFYEVRGREDLTLGRYGLLEPAERSDVERVRALDLVMVPGLAFDRAGHRLGRGGGYYDRAFAEVAEQSGTLLGAAFHFQLVATVPVEHHDRRMSAIVTEEGMVWPPATGVPSQGK